MSVTPPNQSFQYLQGWLPGQDSNILPILAGKGDKNQDQYLEGGKTIFLEILTPLTRGPHGGGVVGF